MGRCVHEADEKWGGESKGADEKWGGASVTRGNKELAQMQPCRTGMWDALSLTVHLLSIYLPTNG